MSINSDLNLDKLDHMLKNKSIKADLIELSEEKLEGEDNVH